MALQNSHPIHNGGFVRIACLRCNEVVRNPSSFENGNRDRPLCAMGHKITTILPFRLAWARTAKNSALVWILGGLVLGFIDNFATGTPILAAVTYSALIVAVLCILIALGLAVKGICLQCCSTVSARGRIRRMTAPMTFGRSTAFLCVGIVGWSVSTAGVTSFVVHSTSAMR
jgi:hypothetical protein